MSSSTLRDAPQALAGLKVLELGQLIAGPFAAKMFGEFGADVVKIEPVGTGDPLRRWRVMRDGTSLWWHVQTRNKRSVALDLKSAEGDVQYGVDPTTVKVVEEPAPALATGSAVLLDGKTYTVQSGPTSPSEFDFYSNVKLYVQHHPPSSP